jgi:hypothetical protein
MKTRARHGTYDTAEQLAGSLLAHAGEFPLAFLKECECATGCECDAESRSQPKIARGEDDRR